MLRTLVADRTAFICTKGAANHLSVAVNQPDRHALETQFFQSLLYCLAAKFVNACSRCQLVTHPDQAGQLLRKALIIDRTASARFLPATFSLSAHNGLPLSSAKQCS